LKPINLSYLVCTYNRLNFIKILLPRLIENIKPDEEIIVVDGNSTDGAKEYLQKLYENGKIHQFVSEPDRNQSEGWNKGLLIAKGIIIKKLIDDDVHDYTAIRKCCDFMLTNAGIDICISNHLAFSLSGTTKPDITGRLPEYKRWKSGLIKTFTFSDVSMLVRRSSLSFLGLYDTQFKMMDWEYSLRMSWLQARIAYYTGYNSLSVSTPGNVTSTATKKLLKYEGEIGRVKYGYPGDHADISFYSKLKVWLGNTYYNLKNKKVSAVSAQLPPVDEMEKIYTSYYSELARANAAGDWQFIY